MRTADETVPVLLERDADLERIERTIDAAVAGTGSVTLIAGPAGAGKTQLLEAALARAETFGARPLLARASELEYDFAFGVTRQLVENAVLGATEQDREALLAGAARHAASVLDLDPDASPDRDVHTTLHGLYWLLANLSAQSPLVVAIDDLQWSDEPSLRWLNHCARRVAELPVALLATVRTGADASRIELPDGASHIRRAALEELTGLGPESRLVPAPLSITAVASLIERELGASPDPAFATECHRHCGGNAFLISQLVAELAALSVTPDRNAIAKLTELVPDRVGESVRRRLDRVGPAGRDLVTAVAVLGGEGVDLALAAQLAQLDLSAAATAATDLVAAQLLVDDSRLRLRHPLLRAAVEAELPALERAALHWRAAALLAEQDAAEGRVATHLLASGGGRGDAWAVERLRAAARSARAQGVPEQAAALLRRALEEPPPAEVRGALLSELGQAELGCLDPNAADHLREAHDLTTEPRERAELAITLGFTHYHAGRHADGVAVVLAAIDETREVDELREYWLQLEALLGVVGRYDLATEKATRGRIRDLAATLEGVTPGERLVLSTAENEVPGPTAQDLFEATTRSIEVIRERPWGYPAEDIGVGAMYLHAGRPDAAAAYLDSLLTSARSDGSPMRHALLVFARGTVAVDVGDLRSAEEDFEVAFRLWREVGEEKLLVTSASFYIHALTGRGDLDGADAMLSEFGLQHELPEQMFFNPLLFSRGMLRLEQRRPDDAAADFRELGRRHDAWGLTRPSPPWHPALALALTAAGQREEALKEAALALPPARVYGNPRITAFAIRAHALAAGGEEAIEGLTEAVDLLEDGPWRLDRARARCDLGAALRRAGRRRDARAELTVAMDEANTCGAELLVALAAEELRASGARPRRRAISGLDSLTPSERRVAELAGEGLTNREIAQELFVTTATVETHLTRVYRKLDVDGRRALTEALASGDD